MRRTFTKQYAHATIRDFSGIQDFQKGEMEKVADNYARMYDEEDI